MKSKPVVILTVMLLVTAVTISPQFPSSNKFRHNGKIDTESPSDSSVGNGGDGDRRSPAMPQDYRTPQEAPTGFDNLSNGFDEQGFLFENINSDNVVALRSFNDNRFIFEEVETVRDGLGPT